MVFLLCSVTVSLVYNYKHTHSKDLTFEVLPPSRHEALSSDPHVSKMIIPCRGADGKSPGVTHLRWLTRSLRGWVLHETQVNYGRHFNIWVERGRGVGGFHINHHDHLPFGIHFKFHLGQKFPVTLGTIRY